MEEDKNRLICGEKKSKSEEKLEMFGMKLKQDLEFHNIISLCVQIIS